MYVNRKDFLLDLFSEYFISLNIFGTFSHWLLQLIRIVSKRFLFNFCVFEDFYNLAHLFDKIWQN